MTACLATGVVALTGASVVLAPSASAGEITPQVTCVLPAGQGTFTGPQSIKIDLDKTVVAPGGSVTGTVTLGESPAKSTVDMTIYAIPRTVLVMHGAATGEVTITGPEVMMQVKKGQAPPLPPYTGNFTVPVNAAAGGRIEFTVKEMVTDARFAPGGQGDPFPTVCTPGAGGDATVADVTIEGAQQEPATLSAPDGEVKPGDSIALSGTRFTANGTPQVSLCNNLGQACDPAKFSESALAIDGQGNLSGTARLAGGIADGAYTVKVSDGSKEATDTLTVKTPVVINRQITLTPGSGPLGTVVQVVGTGYTPNVTVNIAAVDKDNIGLGGTKEVKSDAQGAFSTDYTVTDPATAGIRAREGASNLRGKIAPFTLVSGSTGSQSVSVALAAGGLTMSQAGTGIDFGTATLNGQAQTLNANLNRVTVVDSRGGNSGWSLTGSMSDLVAANGTGTIAASKISWTPACSASESSLSAVKTGSAGAFGQQASTLCSADANPASATGGRFTADAAMTLTTPEFAPAGSYTGTLTLTLS